MYKIWTGPMEDRPNYNSQNVRAKSKIVMARYTNCYGTVANCYGTVCKLLWHGTTTIASYSPRNGNDKTVSLLRCYYQKCAR